MSSPSDIFNEVVTIVKAYGCDNIIKCIIEPRTWLSYKYFGMTYDEGLAHATEAMQRYFDGENSQKKKLPFTYPRTVEIRPSGGPTCESTLIFSAFLPDKGVGAPEPIDSHLVLSHWSRFTVYARPFLGPSTEDGFRQESISFADTLTVVGLKFKPDPYYWVVCSSPDEQPQHTHIWFLVDE